jgi:hypothetical protein
MKGVDGLVKNISDHPVCAGKVAAQHFLNGAATPRLEEGNSDNKSTDVFENLPRSFSVEVNRYAHWKELTTC